jgi:hypothetical protein
MKTLLEDFNENSTNPTSDHDVLVEVRTLQKIMISDFKSLVGKIDDITKQKIDRTEVLQMQLDANRVHLDHETRLRKIEECINTMQADMKGEANSKARNWAIISFVIANIITLILYFFK